MNLDPVQTVTEWRVQGMTLRTGDLIFTHNGAPGVAGQFWRLLGWLIPGDVDHVIVFTGPGGRCVEAGAKGRVVAFEVPGATWDVPAMFGTRGIRDTLWGVGSPVQALAPGAADPDGIRLAAATYCLDQARRGAPYNLNFLDSGSERAFYCSQLAYQAYRRMGIDLNSGRGVPNIPGTASIIFPQEVWEACRAGGPAAWQTPGALTAGTP